MNLLIRLASSTCCRFLKYTFSSCTSSVGLFIRAAFTWVARVSIAEITLSAKAASASVAGKVLAMSTTDTLRQLGVVFSGTSEG
eukprot:g11122.t1